MAKTFAATLHICVIMLIIMYTDGAPLQSVQLTSTLFNGDVAYEGQQVNFTCITRGTDDILTWSSDHYIDDVLQVGFHDGPGFTEYSLRNPSTVATLISATTNDELTVIESRLQITASVQNPISNVSCRINSHGPVSTITFHVLQPSVQLTSTLFVGNLALELQQVNFTCITRSTDDILTWSSDHYIDDVLQVGFHDGLGFTEYSLRNPSTVATLISATTNGGVMVIESRLQIIASMQNPISNVSCRINSHGPMSTIPFQTVSELPTIALVTTKTENGGDLIDDSITKHVESSEQHEDDSRIILGVTIPVVVGVLVAILTGTLLVKCYTKKKKPKLHAVRPSPPSSTCSSVDSVMPLNT